MARISEVSIRTVLDRLDAAAAVEDYFRLEKRGGQYWGLCPFHHEKTPSFKVDPDRKLYYCFGCHKGGTIIDFIMEMDKTGFTETVEKLARRFGIELVLEGGDFRRDDGKTEYLEALAELYRRVSVSFHHLLMEKPEGESARRYILDREITIETINSFRLGYSPADRNWLYAFLRKKGGYSEEFLASSGLFSPRYPRSAFFSNRLMFPIADRQGKTVAFGGRALSSGEERKYVNSAESEIFKKSRNLYAIDAALGEIRSSKTAVIAEGYMDVLALHQAGIKNAVAPLGTAFTDDQARLLRRWADNVILTLDADEAGRTAAVKAILTCRRNGLKCSVAVPPDGREWEQAKDPAEILQKFGPGALQNLIKCSILDFDYLLSRSRTLSEGGGGKSGAAAFLFPYLGALDSEVERDSCMGILADEFGVDRRAVRDDYNRYAPGDGSRAAGRNLAETVSAGSRDDSPRMNGELYLLTAVFLHPRLFRELRVKFSAGDLEDRHARELFIVLEEWFRNTGGEERGEFSPLFSFLGEGGLKDFVLRQAAGGAFDHPERIVRDGIVRIRNRALERRRAEIVRELRVPGLDGSRQGELLSEKLFVDSELARKEETE